VVCVVIHARPSEQFDGREGGLISINKYIKQEKARSVLLRQKNDAELVAKRETILDEKKDGKTLKT